MKKSLFQGVILLGIISSTSFGGSVAHAQSCDPQKRGSESQCHPSGYCSDSGQCVSYDSLSPSPASGSGGAVKSPADSGPGGFFFGGSKSGTGIDDSIVRSYSEDLINIINSILVPLLMAVAFIFFLWGVFKYFILGSENEEERKTGRQFVLWGVIGFAIILSVWGLVAILLDTFSLGAGGGIEGNGLKPPTF